MTDPRDPHGATSAQDEGALDHPSPDPDRRPTSGRSPGALAPDATAPTEQRWTLDEVEACTTRLLGKQGPFRPTVRLVERHGRRFVAKDYRACTPPYRWVAGRWNLSRERQALARLAGMGGVPAVEGMAGRWVMLLTWFPGKDLGKASKDWQTPEFFAEMLGMVQEMHGRGVVHLDLRQRRNVLVQPGSHPAIIDFGAALCLRPGGLLLRLLAPLDTSGVLKYKARARPGSLTSDEERILQSVERRRRWWPLG
jgi:predicted Ser/Thr protein kinase